MDPLLKYKQARVFAPATVANVGSGFDIFGFALNEPGDEVLVRVKSEPGVTIQLITGDDGLLPLEAEKNTAGRAVLAMLDDLQAGFGLEMEIHKKMPIGSGLGSSAASAVAGVVALNSLLKNALPRGKLLEFAIEGEKVASGESVHLDNISACLYGGFILVHSKNPIDIVSIPTPLNLQCSIIHPRIEIRTSESRKLLKSQLPLSVAIRQWANVAGAVAALFKGDYDLLKRSLKDEIAEPDRAILIPSFSEMKEVALNNGASGFGISGSGPSVFALSSKTEDAQRLSKMVSSVLKKKGIEHDVYISGVNHDGPQVLSRE